jgi:hypothetical protein
MSIKDLINLGGQDLVSNKGSVSQLITALYPEHDWLPWRFDDRPLNFWEDAKNQRKFMEWAGKQLNVREMSDWYKVTQKVTLP